MASELIQLIEHMVEEATFSTNALEGITRLKEKATQQESELERKRAAIEELTDTKAEQIEVIKGLRERLDTFEALEVEFKNAIEEKAIRAARYQMMIDERDFMRECFKGLVRNTTYRRNRFNNMNRTDPGGFMRSDSDNESTDETAE